MRCDVVRKSVEEDFEKTPVIQAHLAACATCREYLREWELLRSGLAVLAKVEPPAPSLGFAERVVRRLQDARDSQRGQQFILQAGRRMVYATLLVAVMFILGLVVPSSGPLRTPMAAESVLSETQLALLPDDQIMGIDESATPSSIPANPVQPKGQEPK
jgi:anti-sigma factor RsiW